MRVESWEREEKFLNAFYKMKIYWNIYFCFFLHFDCINLCRGKVFFCNFHIYTSVIEREKKRCLKEVIWPDCWLMKTLNLKSKISFFFCSKLFISTRIKIEKDDLNIFAINHFLPLARLLTPMRRHSQLRHHHTIFKIIISCDYNFKGNYLTADRDIKTRV